jgi:hypothetical protein
MTMLDNDTPRWLYVDRGLTYGPFTDWERGEIDSSTTAWATYTWEPYDND